MHSLRKRYLFKLITSFLVVPLNLLTVSIIAKTLGPELYGEYRYLIYFFSLLSSFIGFGGSFFSTELAKDHFDRKLIIFYKVYIILNWAGVSVLVFAISYSTLFGTFFPGGIELRFIWIAFLLSFLTFISTFLESMTDSSGLTKNASIFNFVAKLAGVLVLLLLVYVIKWDDLFSVFLYGIVVAVFAIAGFGTVLRSNDIPIFSLKITLQEFKDKFTSLFNYSHPLLVLAISTFAVGFLSRWLLQFFGGSIQQGYFSFSDSFSAFIIIFSNSIAPLLQREFSISFNNQDMEKMKNLFHKSILLFTAVTSYLSVFIIFNAGIFTLLVGGKSFENAILPTQIMLLYPIPYIINNILYVTLYATGRTPLLRNVQILMGILNLLLTFFLVAPPHYFGLQLGAVGFAISTVVVTYLNHVILLKYCASFLNLEWMGVVGSYIKIIIVFVIVGIICKIVAGLLLTDSLFFILISGLSYTCGVGFIFFKFPNLLGFSATEIQAVIAAIPQLRKIVKKERQS